MSHIWLNTGDYWWHPSVVASRWWTLWNDQGISLFGLMTLDWAAQTRPARKYLNQSFNNSYYLFYQSSIVSINSLSHGIFGKLKHDNKCVTETIKYVFIYISLLAVSGCPSQTHQPRCCVASITQQSTLLRGFFAWHSFIMLACVQFGLRTGRINQTPLRCVCVSLFVLLPPLSHLMLRDQHLFWGVSTTRSFVYAEVKLRPDSTCFCPDDLFIMESLC